jgi:hypothetical protein
MASKTITKKPIASFGKHLLLLLIDARIIEQSDRPAMTSSTNA